MQESDYKLIRQVGSGISGAVWSADGPSGRVAMRRFASPAPQDSADWSADRAHFLQGARQSLTLRNPRIVSVFDVIDDGKDIWTASEFVSSESLDALLKRERLPVEQTNYMLRLIALTLDSAHRVGVTHGDLKPSNVFVGEKRSVRLADFAISPRSRKTPRASTPPGWAHSYLSPEHLIAPASIGAQSDQFSLAALAYHMYTGRPPFAATGGDPGPAILRGQVPSPSSVDRNLPPGLDIPILRALSRDPAMRYTTCVEFIENLEGSLIAVPAPPVPAAGKTPALMYAGLASVLVALGIVGWLAMAGGRSPRKTDKATETIAKVEPPPQVAPAPQPAPAPAKQAAPRATNSAPAADPPAKRRPFEASAPASAPANQPSYRTLPADPPYSSGRSVGAGRQQPAVLPPAYNPPVPRQAVLPSTVAPARQPAEEAFSLPAADDAPKGYSLAVYSRRKLIGNGISFGYKDPNFGQMGSGDLRAQVRLNGPPGKGRLTVEWKVDGITMDARPVSANTVTEFHNEPIPGTYRVILRQDTKTISEYTFVINP